jgi:hypothetical protein
VHCAERSVTRNALAKIRRHHQRHRRRQASSTGSNRLIAGVRSRFEVKPVVDPGEARNAVPRGAVGAAEGEEIKRHGGSRWQPATGSALATLARVWDVTNIYRKGTAGSVK